MEKPLSIAAVLGFFGLTRFFTLSHASFTICKDNGGWSGLCEMTGAMNCASILDAGRSRFSNAGSLYSARVLDVAGILGGAIDGCGLEGAAGLVSAAGV